MMSEAWQSDPDTLRLLRKYDREMVSQPDKMQDARKIHNNYCDWLLDRLKNNTPWNITRLEFTGSSYEGLKVGDEIEFDVMVIIDLGVYHWSHDSIGPTPPPGHYRVRPGSQLFPGLLDAHGQLSAKQTAQMFQGMIQKSIDSSLSKLSMKLRQHGTVASQVDIFSMGKWYHVDLVPCLEVSINDEAIQFVAKPKNDDETLWRRSYSIMEKNELRGIDVEDDGCRKMCLKIIKVMKEHDPVLKMKALTSYYLKTALLLETRDLPKHCWGQDQMLIRFMGLMKRLENAMDTGKLECRFNTAMNVLNLDKLDQATRTTIRDRLHVLRTNQREFLKIMSPVLSSG